MTAAQGVPAFGADLQFEDPANAGTWLSIPGLTNITPSGTTTTMTDSTHMQGQGWKEVTPTLHDGGTVAADINFNPSNAVHKLLRSSQLARTKLNIRRLFPDATYTAFSAYVGGIPEDMKVSDIIKAKLSMHISGPVTPPA